MRLQVGKLVGRTEVGELGRLAKIFPKSEKSSQNFENLPKIISISGKGVWRKWEAKLKVLGRFWFYFGKILHYTNNMVGKTPNHLPENGEEAYPTSGGTLGWLKMPKSATPVYLCLTSDDPIRVRTHARGRVGEVDPCFKQFFSS